MRFAFHLTTLGVFFLLFTTNALAAETVIYESTFDSEPSDWITDDETKFFWQASTSAQYAQALSQSPGGLPNRYFVTETELDPTQSFILEADMKILKFNGSSVATFGLYADDLESGNIPGPNSKSDGTLNLELITFNGNNKFWMINIVDEGQNDLGAGGIVSPGTETDVWYNIRFEYDVETQTVTMLTTNKDTGALHRSRERVGVQFNPDMRFLGVATHPQGLPNTTMGAASDPGGNAEFLIDNVILTQITDSAAPEVSNLGQFKMFGLEPNGEGDTFIGNTAVFKAEVTDPEGDDVQLEIELVPTDGSNTSTYLSDTATSGSEIEIEVTELIPSPETVPTEGLLNEFRWRARGIDINGNEGVWHEFGAVGNTDFTAHYTPGLRAAELANELLGEVIQQQVDPSEVYELGARGWDYINDFFVSPAELVSGYNQKNGLTGLSSFAPGIDCSGLIYWAFNKSIDPFEADNNYVANITADGMFRDKQSDPIDGEPLPGDTLSFTNAIGSRIVHVAMYVGESGGYDIVNASSETAGITTELSSILTLDDTFAGYRHIHQNDFEGAIRSYSPVDLIVTDPEGFVLSFDDIIPSELEFVREVPGELYYSEIKNGQDGRPEDIVYIATIKDGLYKIEVVPNSDAGLDETYSLEFVAGENILILAQDESISNIPSLGYAIQVSDGEVEEIEPELSLDELWADLGSTLKSVHIKNPILRFRVLGNFKLAKKLYKKNKLKASTVILKNLQLLVKKKAGKGISAEDAEQITDVIIMIREKLQNE